MDIFEKLESGAAVDMYAPEFQGIGMARTALLLSFYRKGILDLPLMVLANLIWPLYGLMLVQPFMECTGSLIALLLYRKERKRGLDS